MKFSAAVLAFAAAVAAKPAFLNTQFNVVTGQPFELKYSGCELGCTILLKGGPSGNLVTVATLTTGATGSSTTVTVSGVPSGTYAFEIVDSAGENNYSEQFQAGSGTATSSASASSTSAPASTSSVAVSTTTSASSSSSSVASSTSVVSSTSASSSSSSSSSSSATTLSTVRSSSAVSTPASTTTSASSTSATATSTGTAPSTVPSGGAGSLSSSLSLVVGAVAALVLVN